MALVTLPNYIPMFPLYLGMPLTPAFGNELMDATGEAVGFTLVAVKTGTISKVGIRTGPVTTGQSLDVRIETVGADGFPTGTLWAANTNASQAIADTDDNTWFWVTLTAGAVVTQGQQFCIAIRWVSTVGNLSIAARVVNIAQYGGVPFEAGYTTLWTSQLPPPNIAVEYSDASRPFMGCVAASAINANSFSSSSTPDERGIIFQYPVPCKVIGALVKITEVVTTFAVKLYDSDGTTVLESVTGIDGEAMQTTQGMIVVLFDTAPTLLANTNYRLTVLPETTTAVVIYDLQVDAAATMESLDRKSTL